MMVQSPYQTISYWDALDEIVLQYRMYTHKMKEDEFIAWAKARIPMHMYPAVLRLLYGA